MSDQENINTDTAKAIEGLLNPLPRPIPNGYFIRHMFLEAVFIAGGPGAALDKEDIQRYSGLADKEFNRAKTYWITKGVIKEETNRFDVTLYSLNFTPQEGGVDSPQEVS